MVKGFLENKKNPMLDVKNPIIAKISQTLPCKPYIALRKPYVATKSDEMIKKNLRCSRNTLCWEYPILTELKIPYVAKNPILVCTT
jgi:hypothetical protein